MTPELILPELCGGLWHTTHPDRFKRILMRWADCTAIAVRGSTRLTPFPLTLAFVAPTILASGYALPTDRPDDLSLSCD